MDTRPKNTVVHTINSRILCQRMVEVTQADMTLVSLSFEFSVSKHVKS